MLSETAVTVAAGVVFGLALAAPPGPMNAIIAQESVVRGWLAGFRAGLGALTADLLFFLLAVGGLVTVVDRVPGVRAVMVTIGGLLMLYFAVDATRNVGDRLTGSEPPAATRSFSKTFVLALTNPYQILFWLTVGIGLLDPGTLDVLAQTPYVGGALAGRVVVETGSPALLFGFFGGILCWIVTFPAVLVASSERVTAVAPVVSAASAVVLCGFGVVFLSSGVATLL